MSLRETKRFFSTLTRERVKYRKFKRCSPNSRNYATVPSTTKIDHQLKPDFSRALNYAIKVVGRPSNNFVLETLSPENANNHGLGIHLRKLLTYNHPLIKVRKEIVSNEHNVSHINGVLVLLMAKAGGFPISNPENEDEIAMKQHKLSSVTERLHIGNIIHKSVVNIPHGEDHESGIFFGNKIAILVGDIMMATAFGAIASLHFPKVSELMAMAISDTVESEILNIRFWSKDHLIDDQNWLKKNYMAGSLLANAFKGSLLMARHSVEDQDRAAALGRALSLAWRTSQEVQPFLLQDSNQSELDLTSLPVSLFFTDASKLSQYQYSDFDFQSLHRDVANSSALSQTLEVNNKYVDQALDLCSYLQDSDSKYALNNIILAFREN